MRTLIVILVLIFVTISSFAATTYLGVECDTNGAVVFPTNFFTGNVFGGGTNFPYTAITNAPWPLLSGTNVWTGTNTFDTNVILNSALEFNEVPRPDVSPSNTIYMWVEDMSGLPALRVRDWNGLVLGVVRDNVWIARCATPGGIKKGEAIYNAGLAGTNLVWIDKAQANDPAKMPALGVAAEDIAFLKVGRVLNNGLLPDFNTTNWPGNAVLYVSDSVAGGLTNAIPIVPNIAQQIGFVQAQDPTNGSIQIEIGAILNDATGTGQTNWYFGPYGTNFLSFSGSKLNGAGITNGEVTATSFVGSIGSTNITGQITLANLPSEVLTNMLTNNWNGPRVTITNSSLLVTGAQYIALSNGAARVILTNGTVTASGIGTFVGVDAGNGGGVTCERLNLTIGTTTQSRLACITPWTFVFEGTLAANPATNFTFGTPADATNCSIRFSPNGLHGKTKPTVTFISASGGLEDVIVSGVASATNGVLLQVKPQFTTNFTCTTNLQTYICNGTNQVITLPTGAAINDIVYLFSCTNGWGKLIISNSIAGGTIRDGFSPTFTQVGIGSPSFFTHDGGTNWVSAARTKVVMPNAQFSCTTNIPMTLATTSYAVTFNSTDFNNSQGIALLAGTNVNGFASKMWITNSGQYEFSPSIVINFGGNNTVTTWFKKDDVNIPNSATAIKGAAGGSIRCVTIPFVVSVTNPASYEIWVQSTSTGDSLSIQAAGGAAPNDMPLSPSVICPVKKISDLWP